MGIMGRFWSMLFGGNRNIIAETVEVFKENTEQSAIRSVQTQNNALGQFSQEFTHHRISWFDSFINGLNRLPRPMMALGVLSLFAAAMYDPIWFSQRMQGLALIPEPLWWLMGAIVSFYFGARYQVKHQEFKQMVAHGLETTGEVMSNLAHLERMQKSQALDQGRYDDSQDNPSEAVQISKSLAFETDNPALKDWLSSHAQ